jgi:hypothetical protein
MAQTKTRSSKPKSSSRKSGSSKAQSRSASKKSSSQKSRSRGKSKPKASGVSLNGAGQTAKQAGKSVGRVAGKAKVPLVAGGAALMGAAGGLAMGARSQRVKGLAKTMQRPKVKVKSRDVKHAAKEVGAMGAQMGRLASELQAAREQSNGKHRSPIEVVLQGLTSRGSRR